MSGLKVIGVGFGRTGTFSLKSALDRLGFNCYHIFDILDRSPHASLWLRVYDEQGEERKRLFDEIFAGYDAVVDFPGAQFYRDLLSYYPDAKIILTVRDSNSWYESFKHTLDEIQENMPYALGQFVRSYAFPKLMKKMFITKFDGRLSDREHVIQVFEQHNNEVIKQIPAKQLLVYRIEDGWKPLCEFLNVPVPEDTPFPNVRGRGAMLEVFIQLKLLGWLCIFVFFAIIFLVCWLFSYW